MKLSKLYGIHAIQSALTNSPDRIHKVWLDGHRRDQRLLPLIDNLIALGIEPENVDRKKLDRLTNGKSHQGIVIEITLPGERNESELKDTILGLSAIPLLLVLDNIQDPHNLGACLRTADAAGVHGVIITKDNSADINSTVCKVASGAAETLPVFQVTNLARTLRWLKDQGIWIMGAAGEATQSAYQTDLTVPLAIVMGAEGKGLRRLTREHCDGLIKLPMFGQVSSLNVSVASGILLYEAVRQRHA